MPEIPNPQPRSGAGGTREYGGRPTVQPNGSEVVEFTPIPSGESLILKTFGAADELTGSANSSLYILEWGSGNDFEFIRAISVSGNTKEIVLKRRVYKGDGTKFLRVTARNISTGNKELYFWLEMEIG
jgi:hypothetical protein